MWLRPRSYVKGVLCVGFLMYLTAIVHKSVSLRQDPTANSANNQYFLSFLRSKRTVSGALVAKSGAHRIDFPARKFVYLIQTSKCLPRRFLAKQVLGSSGECNCEVIVLSFKERCDEAEFPSHITYVFNKNISWAAGRNELYDLAKARDKPYLYYIMMDDDIVLSYNQRFATKSLQSAPPLRAFEKFLVDYEPAVGTPNYVVHHTAETMLDKRRQLCRHNLPRNSSSNNAALHVPVTHFDASFNAFHRDSVAHILPYPTKFDRICWWHSQRYVIAATELKYRGHAWIFSPVSAFNTQHGQYPRQDKGANGIWSDIVRDIARELPREYRGRDLVKQFIRDPVKYTENSLSVCFDYKPHHPLARYSHFDYP